VNFLFIIHNRIFPANYFEFSFWKFLCLTANSNNSILNFSPSLSQSLPSKLKAGGTFQPIRLLLISSEVLYSFDASDI